MLPNFDNLSSAFGGLEGLSAAFMTAFVVALLEAFALTTLLVPGCLMTVGMGVLLAFGRIHPVGCVAGVLAGMWIGDQISFLLARCASEGLARWKMGQRLLAPLRDIGRSPARKILLAHFCPHLSGLAPAAAGAARVPYARFIVYDSVGVVLGTGWFLGVGAGIGTSSQTFANGLVAGVGLTVLTVVVSIVFYRATRASYRRRGIAFLLVGIAEYPVFLIQGIAYRFLPKRQKEALKQHRDEMMRHARPGDILLVTRHAGGPWGKATHTAIFETTESVIHAFHRVRQQNVTDLPLRDGFQLLRVELTPEQREMVLQFARNQIGKKFRIATTIAHVKRSNPRHFSCATLIWAAFKSIDIDLAAHVNTANRWVFPRDFRSSPHTREVPIRKIENGPVAVAIGSF